MALLDVQVTLAMLSGIPEDAATNVWHFDDGEQSATWESIASALEDFYAAFRIAFSPLVANQGHEIKMYRVSDPEPRAPVYQTVFQLGAATSGSALPPEVSVVLSYHAEQVSGVPQARRRGRVYLGPLNTSQVGSDGRLSTVCLTNVENAVDALLAEQATFGLWKWSTHSKVSNSGAEVAGGWVDNEPDTQRRRGREATVREVFVWDQA